MWRAAAPECARSFRRTPESPLIEDVRAAVLGTRLDATLPRLELAPGYHATAADRERGAEAWIEGPVGDAGEELTSVAFAAPALYLAVARLHGSAGETVSPGPYRS